MKKAITASNLQYGQGRCAEICAWYRIKNGPIFTAIAFQSLEVEELGDFCLSIQAIDIYDSSALRTAEMCC